MHNLPNVSSSFKLALTNSLRLNNWELFIETYGTHYIYETILGGRAVQEMIFTSKAIDEMQHQHINLEREVSASMLAMG